MNTLNNLALKSRKNSKISIQDSSQNIISGKMKKTWRKENTGAFFYCVPVFSLLTFLKLVKKLWFFGVF